jgi:hypothetical protein
MRYTQLIPLDAATNYCHELRREIDAGQVDLTSIEGGYSRADLLGYVSRLIGAALALRLAALDHDEQIAEQLSQLERVGDQLAEQLGAIDPEREKRRQVDPGDVPEGQ